MKSMLVCLALAWATVVTSTTWHVEQGTVRVICPMTIGGSFEAKTTAISGSLTAGASGVQVFEGSLAVNLRTLDTGIDLRNKHLRENYLEVGKGPSFDTATLSQIDLNGFSPETPEGKRAFTALLSLHGVTKSVTGRVEVRRAGAGLRVQASFPVDLSAYSIREPRYLGIGVKDIVQVEVAFAVAQREES